MYRLLDALGKPATPSGVAALLTIAVLGRMWARHFERGSAEPDGGEPSGVRPRPVRGRGPGDRIE